MVCFTHAHNKLGWEDSPEFITQQPPGRRGAALNRTSVLSYYLIIFFKDFFKNFFGGGEQTRRFKSAKLHPRAKMRRWTLRLRAQLVLFILGTCIICQCGLINGESKSSFYGFYLPLFMLLFVDASKYQWCKRDKQIIFCVRVYMQQKLSFFLRGLRHDSRKSRDAASVHL